MQYGVIPVIEPEEAEKIRKILEPLEWQQGKARTAELTGTVKRNKEMKPGEGNPIVDHYSKLLSQAVMQNQAFSVSAFPAMLTSFKFNKYGDDQPGGEYKYHTDAPWMGKVRTDFTLVLALTDPDTYEGGDHWVRPPHQEPMKFRPKQGELMFYETGYQHYVEPVTKGSRISALAWSESSIPSERQRACSAQLWKLSKAFEAASFDQERGETERNEFREWFVDIGMVHSALQRMWGTRK